MKKSAPTTTGFQLLQARARELIAKDSALTSEMAIMKASEMFPNLAQNHESEMRKVVG